MMQSIIGLFAGMVITLGLAIWVGYKFIRVIGKDFDLW